MVVEAQDARGLVRELTASYDMPRFRVATEVQRCYSVVGRVYAWPT
jgi:hypothetical protein